MSSRNSKSRARLLAAWLAAAGAALAQTASTASGDKPAGVVAGVVTNAVTGEPLLRAHVSLRIYADGSQQTYGALTNAEGKFTIRPIPPGQYSVTLDRVGFTMPAGNPAASNFSFTLGPGERKEDLKLSLVPGGAIIGRVLTPEGEPVFGASVVAEGSNAGGPAVTDEKGQFRLGGLRPGKYRIKAAPQSLPLPPEIRADGAPEPHYSPTYFPASLDAKSATRIEVRPAAELSGIDIRLVRTPIIMVSGRVSGFPADARAIIQAHRSSTTGSSGMSGNAAKPDGSFQLWRLDPGKYTLLAMSFVPGSSERLQSPPVEIEVGGVDIENVEMRLIPPFDIPGQVRFEDEQARQPQQPPGRQGQPQAAAVPMPRRIALRPVGGMNMYNSQPVELAADDSFTLDQVQPGRYHVALTWGQAYVKSVRLGSTETEGDILDVRGGPGGPLTLFVTSLACEVSGKVSDSKGPVPGASVVLVSDEDGPRVRSFIKADNEGTYKFGGLPPGRYKVLLTEDIRNVEDYADMAEVELRPGDKVAKDLKQPSTGGQ